MRWLGLGMVALLVACSGPAEPGSAPVDARSYLLRVDDLPRGFDDQPVEVAPPGAGTSADCRRVLEAAVPSASDATAKISYGKGSSGPYVSQQVQAWSGDGAEHAIDDLRSALSGCRSITLGDTRYDVAEVPATARGDESEAFQLSAVIAGQPFTSTTVVTRVDDRVTAVTLSQSSSAPLKDSVFDRLLDTAVRRLDGPVA